MVGGTRRCRRAWPFFNPDLEAVYIWEVGRDVGRDGRFFEQQICNSQEMEGGPPKSNVE